MVMLYGEEHSSAEEEELHLSSSVVCSRYRKEKH